MTSEEQAFAQAIGALRPYLSKLVVVGGWAHRLFRLGPGATAPSFPALMTDDADIATPLDVKSGNGNKPIDTLLKEAGFDEVLAGDEQPPVAYYVRKAEGLEFELEFIANKTGAKVRRNGSRDVTATVAGVVAQKLPHVDSLLVAPWIITLDESVGFPVPGGPAAVQIANPASYLFQKLMVLPARTASGKGAKDVLYIFDTFQLLSSSLDQIKPSWQTLTSRLREADRERLAQLHAAHFASATSDNVVAAAQLAKATGRPNSPSAAIIAATCRAGFSALFAADPP